MARGDSSEEELMHHVPQQHDHEPQHITSLDPPPQPQHPFNFSFPTLADDGSVPDLAVFHSSVPSQYSTPPAALSALGTRAAMADRAYESSLADQYDIIDPDDLSEMSNDDHDTASIASTEQDASDDEDDLANSSTHIPPHSFTESMVMVESSAARQIKAENELIDSYMSEDLETPRQSTANVVIKASERPAMSKVTDKVVARHTPIKAEGKAGAKDSGRITPVSRSLSLMMSLPVILLLIATFFSHMPATFDLAARREALSMSIAKVPGIAATSNNNTDVIDLEHLLPTLPARCYRKTLFNQVQTLDTPECAVESRFQPLEPNHIVISIPGSPHVVSTDVHKSDGRKVTFNRTQLIEGVSLITFDPTEMYDTVTVVMLTKRPSKNITASHYYGRRFLQRRTYEYAGAGVGKKVGSDLAIISGRAQNINRLLSNKVTGATRNLTSSLTKYVVGELQVVSRELQLMRKTASSMLPPFVKDPTAIRKDLVKYTHDLSGSVKSTMQTAKSSTKALVRERLTLSRERLLALQQALRQKKEVKQARKVKSVASEAIQVRAAEMKAKQQLPQRFDSRLKLGNGLQTAPKQRCEAIEEKCRKSKSEQHYWL